MRKFGFYFFAFWFSISLSLFTLFFVINSTILNGGKVKSWIENADTVNLFVENSLYLAKLDEGEFQLDLTDTEKLEIGQSLVEPVGENLITPQLNSVIDQAYDWLGSYPYERPTITIDLSQNKDQVREIVIGLLDDYSDKLPKCTNQDEGLCLPENTSNLEREINKLFDELSDPDSDNAVFVEQVFPPESVNPDEDIYETLETIHSAHSIFKTVYIWLIIAVLLFAGLIELVSKDRLLALRTLSKIVVGSFALPVILGIGVLIFLPQTFAIDLPDATPAAATAATKVVSPLIREIILGTVKTYLTLGLPLLLASIGGMVFIHKKHAEKISKPATKKKK